MILGQFKEKIRKAIFPIFIILVLFAILLPIYWLFVVSLTPSTEFFGGEVKLYPTTFFIRNFSGALSTQLGYVVNSLIVATSNMGLVLMIAIPAAYAFSRSPLFGGKHLFFWILTNVMAPPAIFILPLFLIATALNLFNTYLILILVYCVFNLPFAIWLLKGSIDGIPVEIDDAARVDGCSSASLLGRIIIPLIKPGIAATGLFVWIFAWNHYIFAMILTGPTTRTITTGITEYVTVVGIDYGALAATAVITLIPAFIIGVIFQRYIIRGLTFGAIKE